MKLEGKKVLVFGSGISGIAAAKLLEEVNALPTIYDANTELNSETILERVEGNGTTKVILGELSEEVICEMDLMVISPGVPTDLPLVKEFREKQKPIWGEIELAFQVGKGDVLAITGTNGKTTTTALLGQIMKDYKESAFVVGNIGIPYTSVALDTEETSVVVAEVSSFQLETIESFKPVVSAILNITEDHMDRHHTMEEYIRVKENITANQGMEDFCVLNYEDLVLREFGENLTTNVIFFSSAGKLEKGIYLEDGNIILKTSQEEIKVVHTEELQLLGTHNYENVMAAVAMAYAYNVPMESIRKTICEFQSVEHRIEFVIEKNGVAYYNDSKGTNPDAAIKGIQAMNRKTLLIGGGYDKSADFTDWIKSFDGKVRYLVLIGQTKEKIRDVAQSLGFMDTILVEDLEEAVTVCSKLANPGDAVLLSPACASWGQFKNYEIRGQKFKEYVHAIEE